MKVSFTLFAILALLAIASAVKFRKTAKQADCSWDVKYKVNGQKGTATITVPAKTNKNLSGSGNSCKSNGVAKGSIAFVEDGKTVGTVGISAEFGKKGVSAGSIVQCLHNKKGKTVIPAAYYLAQYNYGDLVEQYLSNAN